VRREDRWRKRAPVGTRVSSDEIGDYLLRVAGNRTALKWIDRPEAKALGLARQPYAGAESADLGGRRRVVVRPYLIIYCIAPPDLVRIVRIVHGARDLPALFSNEAE
jgi:plasmid stabilization system protein ParE